MEHTFQPEIRSRQVPYVHEGAPDLPQSQTNNAPQRDNPHQRNNHSEPNNPSQRDNPHQRNNAVMHHTHSPYCWCVKTIGVISIVFAILAILFIPLFEQLGINSPISILQSSHLDTTEIVESFNDSFIAIGKLGDIDFTPLNTFSSAVWNANKIIIDAKYHLESLLDHTNLSTTHKQELSAYFDKIDDLFANMSKLSDTSKAYYAEESAAIGTFISDTHRMQRMLNKYNFHGIMTEIDYFLDHVLEMKGKLYFLRQEWIKYREQAKQYYKQAQRHEKEMERQQKEAEEKAAAINEEQRNKLNNPFSRLKFIIMGNPKEIYGNSEKKKLNQMAERFKQAEEQFDITASCLDECVGGIEKILSGMNDITTRLGVSRRKMEKVRHAGNELNKLMKWRIEAADYEDLHQSLNDTLYHFENIHETYKNYADVIMITN